MLARSPGLALKSPVVPPLLSPVVLSVLLLVYLHKIGGPEAGAGIFFIGEIIQSSRRTKKYFVLGYLFFWGDGERSNDFSFLIVHFLHRC